MSQNKHSKSSKKWLKEHFSDQYVQQAKKDGYRSRAAYKLIDLQRKFQFIKPNKTLVDLGAAPGGWSHLASQWLGEEGHLLALDILPMNPIPNVQFIQGDFTEEAVLAELELALTNAKLNTVDVVLSDMAPNMSGIKSADQAKAMYLAELALDFAQQYLPHKSGWFVIKLFQGEGIDYYFQMLKKSFAKVHIEKPDASRARSREIYVVAFGLKKP